MRCKFHIHLTYVLYCSSRIRASFIAPINKQMLGIGVVQHKLFEVLAQNAWEYNHQSRKPCTVNVNRVTIIE